MSSAGAIKLRALRPCKEEVEAAARAYAEWQFPSVPWDDLRDGMRNRFREGARKALEAAYRVRGRRDGRQNT